MSATLLYQFDRLDSALIPTRTRTPAVLQQPNIITTGSSSAEIYFNIRIINGHSEVCRPFVCHFARPIDQILAAYLQSATVRSPSQVMLNISYQATLPGVYNTYQLIENSLLFQPMLVRSPYLLIRRLVPPRISAKVHRRDGCIAYYSTDFVWRRRELQTDHNSERTPRHCLAWNI